MADAPVDPRIYQMLVEQTRDYALFVLDPEGHIQTWNAGGERLKGYTRDEIIGRHFSIFYTREALDQNWPAHELKVAAIEGRFEDEGWRVRKDGSRFWANVVITALRDEHGKLLGFCKITRDFTERRLHEEALRQSEERFRLMIEAVRDYAIYMLDPQGMVASWNAGAETIKGYRREDVLGRHFSRFYEPADIDAGRPWEELATARREGRSEGEGWRLRKDGSRFWARFVLTPVYDQEGHLRGYAKVTQDLSERRHAQDLEKAARNVNEFIATLAHELRNPLAPIRTATQVMAKTPPGDPLHESMRQTIERQSAQLSRIVDDLLDITRITRGQLPLEHEPLDLAVAVRRALETAAPQIQTGHHTLEVDVPPGALGVRGDLHRLTQAIANLANNAARYTPSGGSIAIKGRAEGGVAELRIRDTGRGIEPHMLGRIFDMFVQGRQPSERVLGGLGIGLALARRIVEAHGGTLEAHSEGENRGSEFILRLPLEKAPAAQAAQQAEPADRAVARRILVVDDNVDAAVTLSQLLKSLGHESWAVHDGPAALKAAAELRPDTVLLDIGMPGMDGYEVARRLQAAKKDQGLRIIAITGWGQDADRQRSREAGFDMHLVKPVDPSVLLRVVEERNGATLH